MRETPAEHEPDPALEGMHAGELAAISLGMALKADLLLMDDRKGVILARTKGLRVTGTLGILELAAGARSAGFSPALLNFSYANYGTSS